MKDGAKISIFLKDTVESTENIGHARTYLALQLPKRQVEGVTVGDFRYRDMMVIMQLQNIYLAKMAIPLCVVKIFKHLDFW